MDALDGYWKVRRRKGLLPPVGIRKFITGDHGWTMIGPVPVAPFQVKGPSLLYKLWPIRDEIMLEDGKWVGRGYLFGRQFCEFRLLPKRVKSQPQRSLAGFTFPGSRRRLATLPR